MTILHPVISLMPVPRERTISSAEMCEDLLWDLAKRAERESDRWHGVSRRADELAYSIFDARDRRDDAIY